MTGHSARKQRTLDRRNSILTAARTRADAEGWDAVTTRHLAEAIGFSQPVLYGHFPGGKAEIMLAVALEGFQELTSACRAALDNARDGSRIEVVATAYLDFAQHHPSVYEAMFQEAIETPFASEHTLPELRAGFDVVSEALGDNADGAATEIFWAALHGASVLERAGRMRPEHRDARIREIVSRFG